MRIYQSRKGSLTVEAALVLPVFMTGLLTFVSALLMQLTAMRIQAALLNKAKELIVVCSKHETGSVSSVRDDILSDLASEDIKLIDGKSSGMDMSQSDLTDPDYIRLELSCDLIPLTGSVPIAGMTFSRKCLAHAWTGYDRDYFADEEYVYITNDSEVYHCDRNCSHIMLTINRTSYDSIGSLRNDNGAKYKPCEHCHPKRSDAVLYITPDGDRYHNSIKCTGLKRTVRSIRKSEAGDRRPCSRCGR